MIEPVKEEEKTKAGIFLPETANKEKSEEGKVIATGQGRTTPEGKIIPMQVKPGDKVLFTKYGPNEIKVGGMLSKSIQIQNSRGEKYLHLVP